MDGYRLSIAELWRSDDPQAWAEALDHYWDLVQPRNRELEESLSALDLDRLRRLDALGWYAFLHNEYFRWKYTAPNRYGSTTKLLREFSDAHGVEALDQYRRRLLALEPADIASALEAADEIPGLGISGASGLLSLMYPRDFGTVDQFLVKALRQVEDLPEAAALARMNPEGLTIRDGVTLTRILRRKAAELTRALGGEWTPRMIDMVLWAVDREPRALAARAPIVMRVAVIDIGKPGASLGWAIDAPPADGTDLDRCIEMVAEAARAGPVALGFEAPMFVPFRDNPVGLTVARAGECGGGINRPFSASAGATVTIIGLVVVPYVLRRLRLLLPEARAALDWRAPPTGPGQLLLFEAFVTNQRKTADTRHVEDARLAIAAYRAQPLRNAIEEPACLSLLGAAMLRTGWATDSAILAQPCLVVRAADAPRT